MSDDVLLTRDCDTILPYGLQTTPFEAVFKALQDVAGTVWDVDPTAYRAAIAWAYYLTHNRTPLVNLRDALTILPAIAVSEAVPLVKNYMDSAQLVELLARWHEYRPSQAALERLYTAYGMTVDVRPITDAEGQAILPRPVERGAFYVIARAIEWGRGLTPEEISIVADRATPLGGKPVVVYALTDNRFDVATHARTAGASQVVWSDEPAEAYTPPAPEQNKTFYVLDAVTGEELNSTKGVVDHLVCDRYNILEDGGVQYIDVPDNSIEIFLGLSYSSESGSFTAHTFSANDYWGSAILDQSDKDMLEDFGVSILPFSENVTYGPNGSISASNMSSFSFEVLGLYSGMRTGELVADLSNFSAEPKAGTSWRDRICICGVNAYNQNVMTWKCRITKK